MTVVIGVLTVAVAPVGVVTDTVVSGVPTVTVVGEVGIGSVGRETVGTGSVEGSSGDVVAAVEERTDAGGVACWPEACVGAGTALALVLPAALRCR